MLISISSCGDGEKRRSGGSSDDNDSISCDTLPTNVRFKFFLERSGSMTPFDASTTSGDFKAAITNFLNGVPDDIDYDSNLLYIVNDAVYPFDKSYKDFIRSKNIFAATKEIGDPRYTDFTCIFDSILAKTENNEVSVLVSDLIYSTQDMKDVNCNKILLEAKSLTRSVFRGKTSKNVMIVKMHADYDGPYYSYDSPSKGKAYKGQRPYYFIVVATPNVMQHVLNDAKYNSCLDFSTCNGFENYYCFSAQNDVEYSILLANRRNQGRFQGVRGERQIHGIRDIDPDREGNVTMTIAADLSCVILPESEITNKSNYSVNSLSGFKIKSIERITDTERDQKLRYIQTATHFITLTTQNKVANETVVLELKNKLPAWVAESSSDDDTDMLSADFASTTFAFRYLMEGIYEAYYGTHSEPSYFKMEIVINK